MINVNTRELGTIVHSTWESLQTVKNFHRALKTLQDSHLFIMFLRVNGERLEAGGAAYWKLRRKLGNLRKRGRESSLAQHRIERTSDPVDARSWPGSRRLAAARKLASSSQSAWLGASSLLRGLETPKRTHRRVAHPPREREGFFWRLVLPRKTLPDIWQLVVLRLLRLTFDSAHLCWD